LLFTAVVSGCLLVLPLSAGQSAGQAVHHRTLLAGEGPGIILPRAVPVLICAVPVLTPARRRRAAAWASAVLLGAGVLVSLLSVGVLYIPSTILLAVGAGHDRTLKGRVSGRHPAGRPRW
jgi:hypothetical protein